jgi:hypothetical protein
MKGDVLAKTLLIIISILLVLVLIQNGSDTPSATAQESKTTVGRYQISAWAAQAGARTHHAGYYVLDTVTGKIVDSGAEVHTSEKLEKIIREPE